MTYFYVSIYSAPLLQILHRIVAALQAFSDKVKCRRYYRFFSFRSSPEFPLSPSSTVLGRWSGWGAGERKENLNTCQLTDELSLLDSRRFLLVLKPISLMKSVSGRWMCGLSGLLPVALQDGFQYIRGRSGRGCLGGVLLLVTGFPWIYTGRRPGWCGSCTPWLVFKEVHPAGPDPVRHSYCLGISSLQQVSHFLNMATFSLQLLD